MKVKDLVKQLSIYNQDMEIKIDLDSDEEFEPVDIKRVNVKYGGCIFLEVMKQNE